jgi:phosphoglucomutase
MFVSNSDNLGATLDLDILTYFAQSNAPFMMECCERTANDKKGGHLALRNSDNQLILRESAMCADEDEDAFQDITKHRYFNTNNLWIRLDKLKDIINDNGGFIPLPMIKNKKTVDPKDDSSQKVFQLETAMGAAIECFLGATAIVVPRTRFAPVKKCDDLFLLRSDAYILENNKPVLNPLCGGKAPVLSLDSKKYKLVGALEEATVGGIPSLIECEKLKVSGFVRFSKGSKFFGEVTVVNNSDEAKMVPAGVVTGQLDLTDATGMGPLKPTEVMTAPIAGQQPGTSGLRKKTKEFMTPNYLENFVQSAYDAIKENGTDLGEGSLLIGGDGRYFNPEAIQTIIKMGVANGVKRFWVGENGLMSTPAVSATIRERGPVWQKSYGAFILTASHNPGGPEEDFG